jgi:hypothetical protein
MLTQVIWWSSIALEILVLTRGFQGKLASRYPAFYIYICYVLFEDLSSLFLLRCFPEFYSSRLYSYTYWSTELIGVLIGCGVVFEIYRMGLLPYPGTARMARNVLALLFALAIAKGIANAWSDPGWWLQVNARAIEQTLRMVQALGIIALVALFLFYSIPFRSNLRGVLLGYGLFVGARVISLTFVPPDATGFWSYAYSGCFIAALGIWLVHLWSFTSARASEQAVGRLESDYQRVAASTRRRLEAARGQLAKAVRS